MIVTINIGEESHPLTGDYERWISDQIRNRRKAGAPSDVTVSIGGDYDLHFSCHEKQSPQGGGPPRQFTPSQQAIVNLWLEHELQNCPYEPGRLISFLKRLRKLI